MNFKVCRFKTVKVRRSAKSCRAVFPVTLALAIGALICSCADRSINHGPGGTSLAILAASATIDTPSNVVLSSGVLRSATTGTLSYGCTYDGAGAETSTTSTTFNTLEAVLSTDVSQANLFTAPSYMKINSVTIKVRKVGGPTPNMFSNIYATSGVNPSGSALVTSTGYPINTTIANTSPLGHLITFTLPTALEVVAGTSYAVSLNVASNTSLDGANHILWVVSDTSGPPEGCSGFSAYRVSTTTPASWGAGSNGGYRRGFFTVNVDQQAQTGSSSWILDATRSATWLMSTFTLAENPNGLYGGTISYDVGAGTSSTTASYSSTSLTAAQVRALTNLTGRYFYIRANFSVPAPGYDVAAVGDGSISYQ